MDRVGLDETRDTVLVSEDLATGENSRTSCLGQNLPFGACSLNCDGLGLHSKSRNPPSPCPFYLSFFSIHAHNQRSLRQALQRHFFWHHFPKHAFLSHCPSSLGSVFRPVFGAHKVFIFKGIGMDQQRTGISRVSGWCHTHVSVAVVVSV